MADKRIIELPTASEVEDNDFLAVDNSLDGTRKFRARSIGEYINLADISQDSTHRTVTDTEKLTWNTKQNALTFDDAPTQNSNNPVKSGGVYTALSGKQDTLTFDDVPTDGSNNPVKSNGIYDELAKKTDDSSLAPVAKSGSYNDLTDKPAIPEVYGEASGDLITIDDAMQAPAEELSVTLEPQQAGSGDPSPENVRPISGWTECKVIVSPTEDAEDGTTYTIDLGGTYYGVRVNPIDGSAEVVKAGVDLGDLNWTKSTGTDPIFSTRQDYIKFQGVLLCSIYKGYIGALANMPDYSISATNSQSYLLLRIKDSAKWANMDASQFKTAMSGVQLVYELATPIPLTLTPTQIDLLRGINNIWSDGEVYVKYLRDLDIFLNDLARTVADHEARITALENQQPNTLSLSNIRSNAPEIQDETIINNVIDTEDEK